MGLIDPKTQYIQASADRKLQLTANLTNPTNRRLKTKVFFFYFCFFFTVLTITAFRLAEQQYTLR
jgi:hypothetical protein